jgi:hypothetical protein
MHNEGHVPLPSQCAIVEFILYCSLIDNITMCLVCEYLVLDDLQSSVDGWKSIPSAVVKAHSRFGEAKTHGYQCHRCHDKLVSDFEIKSQGIDSIWRLW